MKPVELLFWTLWIVFHLVVNSVSMFGCIVKFITLWRRCVFLINSSMIALESLLIELVSYWLVRIFLVWKISCLICWSFASLECI